MKKLEVRMGNWNAGTIDGIHSNYEYPIDRYAIPNRLRASSIDTRFVDRDRLSKNSMNS